MGPLFSTCFQDVAEEGEDIRILLLGLDSAGKNTIMHKLKLGEYALTEKIDFNTESVNIHMREYNGISLTIWHIGDQDTLHSLLYHCHQDIQGIIFVLDSADVSRFQLACEELLHDLNIIHVPVLLYCNKQDLPDAVSSDSTIEKLLLSKLHPYQHNRWYVQPCCAKSGLGLYQGLRRFAKALNEENQLQRYNDFGKDHLNQ